ncbi:NAD(P)-dependent oxidoreductase [Vallicoccus soli]|uniref:NAD(P)-dependent oxidoreductase n=1 Tax=Vallicoccus soli TaxID=2339232 RepID=UPI00140307EC|nr:NAD(P)-binding oxidoreductase [Vallicoccus soli]
MRVVVLGATGATGREVVPVLLRRGHEVVAVVRDPSRAPEGVRAVVGDARDPDVLPRALQGADAVVSALGPRGRDRGLQRAVVAALAPAMLAAGVRRYVGVSGAGVDAPGDRKRRRDRAVSRLMHLLAPGAVADKEGELRAWQGTALDWTLVRPPRLQDGPATGRVELDPHRSTRSVTMRRADLAQVLADLVASGEHVREAPFAATARGA